MVHMMDVRTKNETEKKKELAKERKKKTEREMNKNVYQKVEHNAIVDEGDKNDEIKESKKYGRR